MMMRIIVAVFFAIFMLMSASPSIITGVNGVPQVPCYFIFGDSLADSGNNNLLSTYAKVNYSPYGIDFPGGVATGRFSNGPTTVDYIANHLGLGFIPPFASATRHKILKGVNYASGGAGIRPETGKQLGRVLSMDTQLNNHRTTVSAIEKLLLDPHKIKLHLKSCIYHIGIGNNDYINNYFMPQFYSTSRTFTPKQYAQALINKYQSQIKILYGLGARKIALGGTGLIGCTPYAISKFGKKGTACAQGLNDAAKLFNDNLFKLVGELNSNFTDAKFTYINNVGIASGDPTSAGFTVLDKPCCQVNQFGQCTQFSTPCQDRATHVFWDNFHPTTRISNFTALRSYTELLPTDTYPLDINSLAMLKL